MVTSLDELIERLTRTEVKDDWFWEIKRVGRYVWVAEVRNHGRVVSSTVRTGYEEAVKGLRELLGYHGIETDAVP